MFTTSCYIHAADVEKPFIFNFIFVVALLSGQGTSGLAFFHLIGLLLTHFITIKAVHTAKETMAQFDLRML